MCQDVTFIRSAFACAALCILLASLSRGDEPAAQDLADEILAAARGELPNVPVPTLGGLQYWNDTQIVGGWRIQQNVLTGHYRLLDDNERRQVWGVQSVCQRRLDAACENGDAKPAKGEVVIVLHGLGSGRWAMGSLVKHLREAGFSVVDVGYSTTSGTVADHAETLAKIIHSFDEAEKLHFVAHSLGNLVTRRYFADLAANKKDHRMRDRIGRMVMLAPPNHGSARAKFWAESQLFVNTLGPTVKEMGPNWKELEATLATPPGEFGIIAGGLGNQSGFNLTIDGDDDGTLSVEETRLDGAADFAVISCTHSLLVYHDDVLEYTTRFLRQGLFQTDNQ
jgi:pimeloyl-ACP methyl ester carboxylesterase